MFTKLKRTATVISIEESTCAFMTREDIKIMDEHFPHISEQVRTKIGSYQDNLTVFRRQMLRNLFYLRHLPNEIIDELICHLEVKRYAKGATILKNGDVAQHLKFLRKGRIDIFVSSDINVEAKSEAFSKTGATDTFVNKPADELLFDTLNTVSDSCGFFLYSW